LALLKSIYFLCNKKGISFHVSVSLDGYGEIHDKVRGIPKVFKKTFETIKEIKANRSLYCDSFDVGCTVISQNVNYLEQLNAFAKKIEIQIKFRMGIENKRIESEKLFLINLNILAFLTQLITVDQKG
jgi:sulfatase maturation enzyme AslB (radical SAM superfamily)